MKKAFKLLWLVLWFGGFGLLPVWLGVAMVISMGKEALVASPWFIVLGTGFSPVTLTVAGITYAVWVTTKGGGFVQFRRAVLALSVQVALLGLVGVGFAWRNANQKADLKAEQEAVSNFVLQSPEIRAWAPNGEVKTSVGSWTLLAKASFPVAYRVSVSRRVSDGQRDHYESAVVPVDVKRSDKRVEFAIRCMVPEPEYRAAHLSWAEDDLCERMAQWRKQNLSGGKLEN